MRFLAAARLRGVLMVCGLLAILATAALAQTFSDPGFVSETVATLPIYQPVGLTWAPDGRMFVWQESGLVRIVKNGVLLATPFLDIRSRVNVVNDRGLLGVALDPNFVTNGYIYLLYTYEPNGNPNATGPKTIRLTRMQADPANPDVALPNSEVVLLGSISTGGCANVPDGSDCIANNSDSHSVGTLRFAPDGKLFASIGDGASYEVTDVLALRAQNLNRYEGKILRINPDGSAPGDNPFDDGTNSVRSRIYAYGLRNPYRFALHPVTGEPMIGDVGWGNWEEQNRGRGANFGWPCYEGNGTQGAYQSDFAACRSLSSSAVTPPLYTYSRGNGGATIGGTFYTAQIFPAQYRGNYFFGDYAQGWIRRMTFDANNNVASVVDFATAVTDLVSLELGPDGALYYISLSTGQVRRIRYTIGPPVAVAAVTPAAGYSPLTVNFSSNGSSDPAGTQLTYLWEFGDGVTSNSPNPSHTYTSGIVQTFTARLTVTNGQNVSSSTTVKVTIGSLPPTATISTPTNNAVIASGTAVTFQGGATDPDETLPDSALSWQVLLHHDDHVHPYQTATGPQGSFTVVEHGGGVYYWEIVLTATDSSGLTGTARVNVYPAPSTGALPGPWLNQDVGVVPLAGSATYSGGTFTVRGNGRDIWSTDDAFHFVYQSLVGDGQITARVVSVENTFQWAKSGVMIRENFTPDSRNAFMGVTAGAGTAFQWRPNPGNTITGQTRGGGNAAPYWVRLVRSGNVFTGYQSIDNVTWVQVGSQTINMPSSVYIGLAVTSTNTAALCMTLFDNVTVSSSGGGSNVPPSVNLTSPANGASFTAPANITLNATASDSDGTIGRVEFYRGTTLIGTVTTPTNGVYSFAWNNVAAGSYSLTARAYDNLNVPTTSGAAAVTVNSGNAPPMVNLTAPSNGASFTAPANITLNATASDSDGTISRVEFYRGTTLIDTITTPTNGVYSFAWNNVAAGSYSLTARAYDNLNEPTTSSAVTVTVNALPTVNLTSPTNGASFTAPASITLNAAASDSDGTINRVEFYQGTTLLNTDTTATNGVYSFAWNNVGAGSYTLTARAYDNANGSATSSTVTVTVNAPPTVNLTAPSSGASFTAPASMTLNATAADSDGTINRVEFYQGAALIGTATTATNGVYSFTWNNVGAGGYTLSARAYDNQNASTTSNAATVTVNPAGGGNLPPTVNLTAPTNGASFTAPANITLNATASDNDGTISRVEFYQGTTLLGTATTATNGVYSFAWNNVSAAGYTLTAIAYDNLNAPATSNAAAITVNNPTGGGLPTPWANRDVGVVPLPGSATFAADTFTVRGNGRDIWSTDDAFHFVYQPMVGDGQITARVASVQNTFQWAKAGVMIRENFNSDSRNALMAVTAGAGTTFQRRLNPGGAITQETNGGGFAAPYWVRLVRSGNTFSAYQSSDGADWTLVGSQTISMASSVQVGLAVTSTNTAALCTVTFDNVTVSSSGGGGNASPTVNLTSPTSGASFTAPANITLNATASDTDGTISRVEFYQGATLIGTVTTATNGVYSFAWNNVGAASYTLTARAYDSGNAVGISNPVSVIVNGASGSNGLRGEYYDNVDFTALSLTRTDTTVNFNWGSGAPAPGMGANTFSARWTGQVQPQFSGAYTFYTTSDDGVRLWVNGQLIINNWTDHGAVENSGTITLVAGQRYDIRLEYYERGGSAVIRLSWSSANQAKQIIPQNRLFIP